MTKTQVASDAAPVPTRAMRLEHRMAALPAPDTVLAHGTLQVWAADLDALHAQTGDADALNARSGDADALDARSGDADALHAQTGDADALNARSGDADALHGRYASVLSDEELARAREIARPQTRLRWIAARAFLRALLGAHTGEQPRRVRLVAGTHGKPMLAGPADLRFNLSHSGPYVLCALTRSCAVGVDVQLASRAPDVRPVARRALGEREAERLAALSPAQRMPAFIRAWAAFEAERKRTGLGIARPGDRLSGPRPWLCQLEPHLLGLPRDAACAVALAAPPAQIRLTVRSAGVPLAGHPPEVCKGILSDYWICSE